MFPHGFDKNAPAQLFALLCIAGAYATYIAIKRERFRFTSLVHYGALGLLASQIVSLLMSGSLLSSLIGDTGRYVGTISVIALLVVALFHTQFKFEALITLLRYYIVAIEIVVVFALAQHFHPRIAGERALARLPQPLALGCIAAATSRPRAASPRSSGTTARAARTHSRRSSGT